MENQAKKLRLEDIKVDSFVTSTESILGGDSDSTTLKSQFATGCGSCRGDAGCGSAFPCGATKPFCLQEEG